MRALKLLISAGVLAALIWWVGVDGLWARLRAVDPLWIAAAIAAMTIATLSMARRWQLVAREMEIDISYPAAVSEYYIAQLGNAVLPGGVVGDVGRALRLRKRATLRSAAESVVVERLLGQIALFAVLLVGLATALSLPGGIPWPAWTWIALAALCAAALIALRLTRRPGTLGRLASLVVRLCQRPEPLLLGLITTGALIFAFYACARATGTALPPAALTTLIPLILCAMLIPLSIAGWGWREGAAAALFPLIGAPAEAGVATGLVYGAAIIASALPAMLILLAQVGQSDISQQDQRT